MKNILIISSDYTGHGHKSITESLCENFSKHTDVKVHVVDGFSLGGQTLLKVGKAYGPITRNAEMLWKLIYELCAVKPSLVNTVIQSKIERNFLCLLQEVKPDLILSVHPNYNGSIINILEKYGLNIPFGTFIADLVSIYPLWADPRVDFIISPTMEAKDKCIAYGVAPSKVNVIGFPVRSRFCCSNQSFDSICHYTGDNPLKCLLMSGGEGVGNMRKIAEALLDNFNCTVKIVAGRNIDLKKKLEQSLSQKYGDKVQIYGFTKDIQDLMLSSDIAFTRGSPNVMMEAISCNIPLIITGALPGQEEGNPEFAEKYNLGVVCRKIENIKDIINNLLANGGEKLNQMKLAQREYIQPHTAEEIVNFILSIEKEPNEAVEINLRPSFPAAAIKRFKLHTLKAAASKPFKR